MNRWPEAHWFGRSWGAPICDPELHMPTPVGEICGRCGEPIAEDENGVVTAFAGGPGAQPTMPFHYLCFCVSILPIAVHKATGTGTVCGAETNESAEDLSKVSCKTTRSSIVTCARCRELS